MTTKSILFIGLSATGVLVAFLGNRWLMKVINPRSSGRRFLLYFIVVMMLGFLLTIAFSYIILKLVVPYK